MERIKKLMKSFYKSSIATSIVLLIIGVLLFFRSEEAIIGLAYIIGTILCVLGIVAVVMFFKDSSENIKNDLNIVYGIVSLILGILVIVNPNAIAKLIPFIVGIIILINSAIKITYSIEAKDSGEEIWKSSLIMAIISLICGIIILFNPFETSVVVFKVIGAFIILYSILDLVYMFEVKKEVKNIEEDVDDIKNEVKETVKEIVNEPIEVDEEDIKVEDAKEEKEEKKDKEDKKKSTSPKKKTTSKGAKSTKTKKDTKNK